MTTAAAAAPFTASFSHGYNRAFLGDSSSPQQAAAEVGCEEPFDFAQGKPFDFAQGRPRFSWSC